MRWEVSYWGAHPYPELRARQLSCTTVRDKQLKARIKQLAVPPAWSEVCIAEDERAYSGSGS